jgi:DNA-binding transcriptional ArsR family regulator
LKQLSRLIIGLDGMQPEKGNTCLYIVRELQCGVTLLAEPLTDSSHETLSRHLLEPLKVLAVEFGLTWGGVVSDAQESIRLAVADSLQGVPHQACQSHCLRDAGQVTFEADRTLKKSLKAAFRQSLTRLRKRIRTLPENTPVRAVLLDYAIALQSTLLEGGLAPFELGGIKVFDALADLEASLLRCQKKGITSCCAA